MTAFAATDLHWPAWTEYLAYAGDVLENLYLANLQRVGSTSWREVESTQWFRHCLACHHP
jgi:hypothetical protein